MPPAYKPILQEEDLLSDSSESKVILLKNQCEKHNMCD
jgi:hypothetical protein